MVLGQHLGKSIVQTNQPIDCIIPVPLHHKKQVMRGFNQSEVIANGISQVLDIPVNTTAIYRQHNTSTQTRKGRFERWKNVESIFRLENAMPLENKHVLIVDDVITTGSTIEACVNTLNTVENITVSIASIACASL